MTDKDPREEKLPRWAQQLLANERRRANLAERKLAEHLETVEPTQIWYGDYDNPVYIPRRYGHQRVHFDLEGRGRLHESINIGIDTPGRHLPGGKPRLVVNGGRGLAIEMHSSNHFGIVLRD